MFFHPLIHYFYEAYRFNNRDLYQTLDSRQMLSYEIYLRYPIPL